MVKKKVVVIKKKVVRKEAFERRRVWKLKEDDTRARFEERVGELVSADAPDLWKCFREGMLKAFDEVWGKTKGRRDQGDTWWWNKDVKEVIVRKKDAHKEMFKSGTCEHSMKIVEKVLERRMRRMVKVEEIIP